MRSGEQLDLYDAIVRSDSIVGRTALVLDAPQRGVATADVAQLKEQKLSALRTVSLSVASARIASNRVYCVDDAGHSAAVAIRRYDHR